MNKKLFALLAASVIAVVCPQTSWGQGQASALDEATITCTANQPCEVVVPNLPVPTTWARHISLPSDGPQRIDLILPVAAPAPLPPIVPPQPPRCHVDADCSPGTCNTVSGLCVGPAGKQGAPGRDGRDGVDGTDGSSPETRFHLTLGGEGGAIGFGRITPSFGGGAVASVEYNLGQVTDLVADAGFGVGTSLLEGDVNSFYHYGLRFGWWLGETVRLSIGGSATTVRNPSFNWSAGGVGGVAGIEYSPSGRKTNGWVIGLMGGAGPGWDHNGQLATMSRATASVAYRF